MVEYMQVRYIWPLFLVCCGLAVLLAVLAVGMGVGGRRWRLIGLVVLGASTFLWIIYATVVCRAREAAVRGVPAARCSALAERTGIRAPLHRTREYHRRREE
jgi:hypothetical protein